MFPPKWRWRCRASEAVEVVVEAAPETEPVAPEAQKDVRPGRRARAERKTRQTKKADATEEAKTRETKEPTEAEKPRGDGKADAAPPGGQVEGGGEPGRQEDCREEGDRQEDCREEEHGQEGGPPEGAGSQEEARGRHPAGYIRELVAGAGAEGIMLSTITDALRAKFKDFKVRDLGYSQMRQYMASVGDYELEKSGRNFRVRLSQ